ncbi:MAG: transcriptional regulator [Nonomuraea sp.]|nr:transcriptional regulator [Nonomuraea sp.]NUP61410.1 transcriptional regulator [Nonomuraea sp.]NUP81726.1 transcriptional regulator [Nonomuraea sp.]NUS06815.1 transcriptional regulator [Nonomuraea sp.]NUT41635.1 transcriptional regulator [Thermoactinospora sp.]
MAALGSHLADLARERATGALRMGADGTVYLSDGRVTYMECARTPGVERLFAARGRMSESALCELQADGGRTRLLQEGPVSLGELQYAVHGVVLDAAYFLLPATGARPEFRPGEEHWLGGQWFFDVAELERERARRQERLTRIWPSSDVDTQPVRPIPRLPGHGVALSQVQWEIVVRADQKATPLELARHLGRSGYSVLLAVRKLAAAGLLVPPDPPPLPRRERHPVRATPAPFSPDPALLLRLKKGLEELA